MSGGRPRLPVGKVPAVPSISMRRVAVIIAAGLLVVTTSCTGDDDEPAASDDSVSLEGDDIGEFTLIGLGPGASVSDPTGEVFAAAGASLLPSTLVLDGEGDVFRRLTGEIDEDELLDVLAEVAG